MRLDVYLTENNYADSRSRASQMIKQELVTVNRKLVTKPSYDVKDGETVTVLDGGLKYVSRGALKLKAALDFWDIKTENSVAVDLGASTGGFCEVLLEAGVKFVYAIDIGHGQLHDRIKNDSRVKSLEGVNARDSQSCDVGEKVDIVTSDLSFISQTLTFDTVVKLLKTGGEYISLIKPQFEAGRENIGKNGLVKDRRVHVQVIESVINRANQKGLVCIGIIPSPINGGDGNREFLARYKNLGTQGEIPDRSEISRIVNLQ